MINAEEARQKTILNRKCGDVLKSIDSKIKEAAYKGCFSCIYSLDEFDDILNDDLIRALIQEIRCLGYKVERIYKPRLTVSPGMYHSHIVLEISWEEERA